MIAATAEGHKWRTIERAEKRLNIKKSKTGMNGGWNWGLLANNANQIEGTQLEGLAAFEGNGSLREESTVVKQ